MRDNRLLANGKAVPLRKLIPNLITLLGLCAGLTAIRMAIEGRFEFAIAAIVIAALFDALDGRMARLLKANSRFGAELDSLADFVNFGVAPAITLYLWGLSTAPNVGWIAAMLFAISAALRLARFNVAAAEATASEPSWQRLFFTGAPTPAGAILLLLPLYLEGLGAPKAIFPAPVLVVYNLSLAALMISRVATYSGKFDNFKIERSHAGPVIVAGVGCLMLLATYPYLTLAMATIAYIASVPFAIRAKHALQQAVQKSETSKPASLAVRLSIIEEKGAQSLVRTPPAGNED
ncbi:MAG: phosphatidylcholine/phosphatidylserine synthase [Hyphomicrobiales bacterium]|nr:phosphatidylcholine/phosphatidylserine synthase [Hyphomicrobiales bacterium]